MHISELLWHWLISVYLIKFGIWVQISIIHISKSILFQHIFIDIHFTKKSQFLFYPSFGSDVFLWYSFVFQLCTEHILCLVPSILRSLMVALFSLSSLLLLFSICFIGPSGVRVLPLAAGINVSGHYKWHFFSFFLSFFLGSLLIRPKGGVVGFWNFTWAPK